MTDPTPDEADPVRAFVRALIPPPPAVDEFDEHGRPLDPWRLAVRRMLARSADE